MKKFLLLTGLFAFYHTGYGQCDKSMVFTCNRARNLINGSIGEGGSIEATITFDDGKIKLAGTVNGESGTMEGEITEITVCEWSDFLKNGKAQYKVMMTREDQSTENITVDIESDNGDTKIIFGSDPDTGTKLQFDVSDYTLAEGESIQAASDKTVEKKKKHKRQPKAGNRYTE